MTSDIRLTIDLGAIAANWRALAAKTTPAECAGVIKADAYGLGVARVAEVLWQAGCRSFFVAHCSEGIALRYVLPEATIYILNGIPPGNDGDAFAAVLVPVVNGLEDLERLRSAWINFSSPSWEKVPVQPERAVEGARAPQIHPHPTPSHEGACNQLSIALHVDTGIHRLGLTGDELDQLQSDPAILSGFRVKLLMSHLVTSETPDNPVNQLQQRRFAQAARRIQAEKSSLSNSSGIFLGSDFHFDLVRPGAALFGVNPTPGHLNPMQNVVTLQARVLKVQDVPVGETVGYGAAFTATRPTRIATLSIGYADGIPRRLGNHGKVFIGRQTCPMAGRVSMDTMTIDITDLPFDSVRIGDFAELIGPNRPLDAVAAEAETIGYEILTGLGSRAQRVYVNDFDFSEGHA